MTRLDRFNLKRKLESSIDCVSLIVPDLKRICLIVLIAADQGYIPRIGNKGSVMTPYLHLGHHRLLLKIVDGDAVLAAGEQMVFMELGVVYDYLILVRNEQLIQE
jgi:hypothetical protein